MRLLDRYLLRELIVPLGYCLCGFFLFWLTFDMFGEMEEFQKAGLGAREVALLYAGRIPELLVVVLPVALLLAMLYCLSQHSRHNELVAARAAGLSLWRICAVHLATGLLLSLVLFAVNEIWAAEERIDVEVLKARRQGEEFGLQEFRFRNDRDRRFWMVEGYDPRTTRMERVHIDWQLDAEALALLQETSAALPAGLRTFTHWPLGPRTLIKIKADGGRFTEEGWTFRNLQIEVRLSRYDASTVISTNFPLRTLPEFAERPRHMRIEMRINSLRDSKALAKEAGISLREIADYRALHPDMSPEMRAQLGTQFHGRIAWPWTCLVVVLISVPFAAAHGGRNAFVGVAASIAICFVYFVVLRVGLALGTEGRIPPWLGAWLPNLLFGLGAVAGMARMR